MMALSRELQVPLRFYVPYGDTLLIYFIRDLLSNPHKLFRPDSYQILGSPATKLVRIIQSL
jgi:proline dehydrogenase